MKFTHQLDGDEGWVKNTFKQPEDFKKVKHLGKCYIDGDMFVAYDKYNYIYIFRGTMEEETLKTNTWYKGKVLDILVYRTGDYNNYGILDELEHYDFRCTFFKGWTEATDDEVEVTLTKLAIKKGFVNINELTLQDFYGEIYHKGMFECLGNNYYYLNGSLYLDEVVIFKHGKWVEILEENELSLEERLKRIEEKLNI